MKFFLVLLLSLLYSLGALATYNSALTLKKVSEDGSQFVFVKRDGAAPWNGITIKDPHTKVILYEARVTKCSATACVGNVVYNHSGLKLRLDEEYVHSYNETPIKVDIKETEVVKPEPLPVPTPPEPKLPPPVVEKKEPPPEVKKVPPPAEVKKDPTPPPQVVKKKTPPKKPSAMDTALYLSYGSPIGPGFKLGFFKKLDTMWAGVNYAKIASTTNNVSIDGHLLSGVASYTVFKISPTIDLNILGELGLAKATLDFTGVDSDGPIEDETTYFVGLAGEGKINFDQFSFALKSGVSKAGFSDSYTGEFSKFNNPYGTMLIFLEIGGYYRF
ncbi:MAG: hypothetical protein H0V66_12020 [Bdellovibrionales bacterium]|nr:hypothetical protein [Bdellovibrionales bacterium]